MAICGPYPGYAQAVNGLVRGVLEWDPTCNWIVTGGDDVFPDPNHTADEIAEQCRQHFAWQNCRVNPEGIYCPPERRNALNREFETFGVMQPTGDSYGEQPSLPSDHPMRGSYATRVCGSPWMGREFCLR